MALIVVEREFEGPAAFEAFREKAVGARACFQAHGVHFLRSYVSTARTAAMCVYEGPDAESVRIALTAAGVPFLRAWTAQVARFGETLPPPPAVTVVVQRELPPGTTLAFLEQRTREGKECFELHSARPVESFLSLDGTRGVCIATAPDAEAVRRANRTMKMPATSIWAALFQSPQS
jgi:hypothetical protein